MAKDLYSTFQAARILGVTPDTVLKWIKRGKIATSRTLGGHYRIPKEKIDELLSEREIHSSTTGTPSSCKAFQFCWEFNSKESGAPDDCRNCLVYKTRAMRCYEMSPVPKEPANLKLFCEGECQNCAYFDYVRQQAPCVLVITDDSDFIKDVNNNKKSLNIEVTDNEN